MTEISADVAGLVSVISKLDCPLFESTSIASPDHIDAIVRDELDKSVRAVTEKFHAPDVIDEHLSSVTDRMLFEKDTGENFASFVLKIAHKKRPRISVFGGKQAILALDHLKFAVYQIKHPNNSDPFDEVDQKMFLEKRVSVELQKGECVLIPRGYVAETFFPLEKRFLYYFEYTGNTPSYEIVFSAEDGRFLGTNISDQGHAKSLTVLDIIEHGRPDLIEYFSEQLCGHSSPIVRWRALSGLNKIGSPKVFHYLEKFADQKPDYLANAAKNILANSKR